MVWKLLEEILREIKYSGKVYGWRITRKQGLALEVITVGNHSFLLGNQIILIRKVHEKVGKKNIGKGLRDCAVFLSDGGLRPTWTKLSKRKL